MSEESKKKVSAGMGSLRGRSLALATALGVTIGAGAACSKSVLPAPAYGIPPDDEQSVVEEPAPTNTPDMSVGPEPKDGADMKQDAATNAPSSVDVAKPAYGLAPIEERPELAPEKKTAKEPGE